MRKRRPLFVPGQVSASDSFISGGGEQWRGSKIMSWCTKMRRKGGMSSKRRRRKEGMSNKRRTTTDTKIRCWKTRNV